MAKIKLTKNELKNQKDSLKMFQRYLPTLILKKQQLQQEIRLTDVHINGLHKERELLEETFKKWIGVFNEKGFFTEDLVKIKEIKTSEENIAGVSIPVFNGTEFEIARYNFVRTPFWLDAAVEKMELTIILDIKAHVYEEQRRRLSKELLTTTQRVNLFEKVKIPETKHNIKKIQVYLGDQQTAAVVRGKIAKAGLEKAVQA